MNPVIFFDSIIFLLITLSLLVVFFCVKKAKKAKRWPFMLYTLALFAGLSGATVFYGSFIEPNFLRVTHAAYHFPKGKELEEEKTIALISDIHVGPYRNSRDVEKTVNKILSLNPDAVLIAGDFFFWHDAEDAKDKLLPLKRLTSKIPTIAVLGNHAFKVGLPEIDPPDYEEAENVRIAIKELGILEIEDTTVDLFNGIITLIGAQDLWSGVDNFESINLPDRDKRTILLSHNPDIIYKADHKVDLVLAGHTHGGQIRLPGIGAIGSPGNTPDITPLPRMFFKGMSEWDETTLMVTSGLGESGARARLLNPPEIVLITLH